MARMYSRKHGKSGSTRPHREEAPQWVDMSPKEMENKIVELAKEGVSPSEIGEVLRDQYGIPSVKYFGLKIMEVLEENDMAPKIPEDMDKLMDRAQDMRDHLEKNPRDSSAKHGLEQAESKIRRLSKYYKRKGKIPENWKYKIEKEFHKRE